MVPKVPNPYLLFLLSGSGPSPGNELGKRKHLDEEAVDNVLLLWDAGGSALILLRRFWKNPNVWEI